MVMLINELKDADDLIFKAPFLNLKAAAQLQFSVCKASSILIFQCFCVIYEI